MFMQLIVLYIILIISRALMILITTPMLLQTGYRFGFKRFYLLNWSALRGAVGLCGAMIVSGELEFPFAYQKSVLFYTSGIVILTIVINGSTTNMMMDYVGLNTINKEQV